jgi:hypothetical protein
VEALEPRVVLADTPIISEFLAVNDSSLTDENGDNSDWIEIHNPTDQLYSLFNWYLTDDTTDLDKWQFPPVEIAPGGHMVVFASGKDRTTPGGNLHTNFRLDGEGDFLALVQPDGTTIASQFGPFFPEQEQDVSFGLATPQESMALVPLGSGTHFIVPTAEVDAAIGSTWTGANEPFDDSAAAGWSSGATGLGFDTSADSRPPGVDGLIAYRIPRGMPGDLAITASLGMDFVVNRPITITSLGAFDDGSNGIRRNLTVQLWSRNDGGTPDQFRDDLGVAALATSTFTAASPGSLVGGSRFKPLATPLVLQPGAYSIVAFGYGVATTGASERAGAAANGGVFGALAATDAVSFVGSGRFNTGVASTYPRNIDLGPPNRYGAGTFTFLDGASAPAPEPAAAPILAPVVAYGTVPGVGDLNAVGTIGMDFDVARPIRITDLGVFDSGQNGITGTLAASIWSRTGSAGTLLADRTFIGQSGTIEPGTGSRFLPLDEPLVLNPGSYTIVASGFIGADRYSTVDSPESTVGAANTGNAAIAFVGTSRYALDPINFVTSLYRPLNLPFHTFPDRPDTGPATKYAAGTFKFEPVFDDFLASDLSAAQNVNSSVYVRVPFDLADTTQIDGLKLKVRYDDGLVVYLNGFEVARRNALETVTWNSTSTAARLDSLAVQQETIDLTSELSLLNFGGPNVLAVQLLNRSATDVDLMLEPMLEGTLNLEPTERFFQVPTPGAINSTESFLGRVADTTFDRDRGFIEAADLDENGEIHVGITSATADAQIYYTTDGSAPTPNNGTLYSEPIAISRTTTLRAAAFKDGYVTSNVDTQTYLFLDDILDAGGVPAGMPTHWNGVAADYGMDQDLNDLRAILGDPDATEEEINTAIKASLRALPTMSIVLDPEDLFGPATGLYSNPFGRETDEWERPASVEYILADGTTGFQSDAGLRMQGWTSRIPAVTPKHSLKLSFREEYGDGRLNFPFWDDSPVDSINTISLRGNNRDAWISDYRVLVGENCNVQPNNCFLRYMRPQSSYIRDQWAKDTLRAMGVASPAGNFVHLYLNGVYWGLYNPTERPDEEWITEYLGNETDDFDVMRFCNPAPEIVDGDDPPVGGVPGDRIQWDQLVATMSGTTALDFSSLANYMRIQGRNPDGTLNPAYVNLIDIDSLIDFMIHGHFHAGDDWPCNFYAYRRDTPDSEGFRFTAWDDDLAMPFGDVAASTVPSDAFCDTSLPPAQLAGCRQLYSRTPGGFDSMLRANAEYRIQFADHIQKHLFHGALAVQANIDRWTALANTIYPSLFAEAARWGDYRRDVVNVGDPFLYTPNVEWAGFVDLMNNSYFPARNGVVLNQWRAAGLYPSINPPTFNQFGGEVAPNFGLELTSPVGTIYYTTDGSDPRLTGGAISETALAYSGAIPITTSRTIKTRVLSGTTWSAIEEATYTVDTPLRITELMYNPPGADEITEFIELLNTGTTPIDLTGVRLVRDILGNGVQYEFLATDTNLTLAAGARMVIAGERAGFLAAYPDVPLSAIADRQFAGNLSNGGDSLVLLDASGGEIQNFIYDDAWHPTTDGDGFTLVVIDSSADKATWGESTAWRPSFAEGGSPGAEDVMMGDIDGNQAVNLADMMLLSQAIGSATSPGGASSAGGSSVGGAAGGIAALGRADLNHDGTIDRSDVLVFVRSLGQSYTPPASTAAVPSAPAALVATWKKAPEPSFAVRTGFFTPPTSGTTGRGRVVGFSTLDPLEIPDTTPQPLPGPVAAVEAVTTVGTVAATTQPPNHSTTAPVVFASPVEPRRTASVDLALARLDEYEVQRTSDGPRAAEKATRESKIGGFSLGYRTRPAIVHDQALADDWAEFRL